MVNIYVVRSISYTNQSYSSGSKISSEISEKIIMNIFKEKIILNLLLF